MDYLKEEKEKANRVYDQALELETLIRAGSSSVYAQHEQSAPKENLPDMIVLFDMLVDLAAKVKLGADEVACQFSKIEALFEQRPTVDNKEVGAGDA